MEHALAVDLGTSGPKVALIAADGTVAARETGTVKLHLGPGGAAEQDPDDWWQSITGTVRAMMARSVVRRDAIVAVAVTAQWSGTVAVGAGGGARSGVWCQIHADVLGRVIRQVRDPAQTNVRGAAFVALLALGLADAGDLERRVRIEAEYQPDTRNRGRYDDLYDAFKSLYKQTRGSTPASTAADMGGIMDAEQREAIASMLEPDLKPYRGRYKAHAKLPAHGRRRTEVLAELASIAEAERLRWESGFASGAVYHGGREHIEFLNQVYALFSQGNPLHADLWPSITKFEAEVVAMTSAMLHGGGPAAPQACGTVTSGGTESILLAMRTYRDIAAAERGITDPEVVLPVTAHAAFDKAAQYFGLRLVKTRVGEDMRADVGAVRSAVSGRTVAVVGSAVQFPHGVADPIEEMAAVATKAGAGFHTDACLGGFVLPWAERLGYPVAPFDFRVPGVTSISCDTHKFGYGAKGTSVLLWRDPGLRDRQYYAATDWTGGLYFSPTFAGSRPGALSAQAWAAMVTIGEDGYLDATRRVLETAATIRRGIEGIGGLRVLGDPLWVIAFTSDDVGIYDVLDHMARRGWSLNGLQNPSAVHLCVTLRHTREGVAERFLADLRACVEEARRRPGGGLMAPVYGMAAVPETRGDVDAILRTYCDVLYRV
ncbi:MAG: aminotransferase class V-fold PLP-dependent enzyme [Micromonosporaceae bacterium]